MKHLQVSNINTKSFLDVIFENVCVSSMCKNESIKLSLN